MRRIELIVTQARKDSENTDFSENRGIPDESFIEWANNAQDRLQSLISSVHADLFDATAIISAVSRQEAYSLPGATYQGMAIRNVEYSENGQEIGFYPLDELSIKARASGTYAHPCGYIPSGKKFLSVPVPPVDSGRFRVTYSKALSRLDKRRGKVLSVALNTTAKTITSLVLDPSALTEDDAAWMIDRGYVCFVDRDGSQKMIAIPVDDIDLTTGVVTVPTFTYQDGETISVGDYVVSGDDATTHCQLTQNCERYLVRALTEMGLLKDSNKDFGDVREKLKDIEEDIVMSFAESNRDVKYVPVTDSDYLDQE